MNIYQKILTVAVILLILLNIALLGFIWKRRPAARMHDPEQRQRRTEMFLEHRLNLEDHQMEEFQSIRDSHQKKMQSYNQEMRRLNQNLHEAVVKNQPEMEKQTLQRIDSLQDHIQNQTVAFIHSLSDICNPDQKDRLLKILNRLPDHQGHRGLRTRRRGHDQ